MTVGEDLELRALGAAIASLPRPVLLGFDVDGTLAPIVSDAASARVPAEAERLLTRLAKQPDIVLALITGRDQAALQRMISLPSAYQAVEHGALLLAPGESAAAATLSVEQLEKLAAFEAWALEWAIPRGATLERKRSSRGVHVRVLQATEPEAAAALLAAATAAAERLGLSARQGRALVEAELLHGDKGQALALLVERVGARGVFFAGDDYTDMPAIATATDLGGIGVFVRSSERPQAPPGATAVVDGPEGVRQLLATVLAALERA